MKRLNKRLKRIEKELKVDEPEMTQQEIDEHIQHQAKEIRRYLYDGVPFEELDLLESVEDESVNRAVFAELTTDELRQLTKEE